MFQRKNSPARYNYFFAELLECRRLLSRHSIAAPDADDQTVENADAVSLIVLANAQSAAEVPLSSVPQLSSDPGAPVTLYLNFLGAPAMTWESYTVPATPAYDQDGDPTTFSSSELISINDIWEEVSESYSPFNINVTTIAPASLIHGQNLEVVIGGTGAWLGSSAGGISYVGAFSASNLPNISFVFPDNLADGAPKYVGDAASHEAGHQFGLSHQAVWSGTTLLEDYNPGTLDNGPIMGNPYSDIRALWYDGINDTSSSTIQNDMAVITSPANGVTYRDDGVSHSISSPTPLNSSAAGILSTTTQVDYYQFSTIAGTISINASQFSIPDVYDGMLKLKFSLYNSSDQLVTSSNAGLTESLQIAVAAGTYTLAVSSDGAYGDVGQYTVSETAIATPPTVPTNPAAVATSSTSIHLSWADGVGDETGFDIERSPDGLSWTQIDSTDLTSYDDTDLTPATTYYYRIRAFNSNGNSFYTSAISATTIISAPDAPSQLLASPVSTTEVSLNWADNSINEAGFAIERSSDDIHWAQVNTAAANATSFTDSGLNPATLYYYRIRAFNAGGASGYSNTDSASTLVPPPSIPTIPQATAVSPTEIDLTWSDNSNQTGFYIQRSTDNANWSQISTSAVASYQDTHLVAGTTYYYRVCAYNAGGNSAFTSSVQSTTLSAANDTPAKLVVTNQPTTDLAGNDLASVSVAVEDASNKVVTNNASSISVTLFQNSTNATLLGTQIVPVTSGIAVFSDLNLTKAGSYTLSFTDLSLASVISSQFTVTPAPVSQLIFDNSVPNTSAGSILPTIAINVEDQYGNLVTASSSISLTSTPGGLQLNAPSVNGVATFNGVSLTQAAEYTLSAAENFISSAPSNNFTVSPGPAAKLGFASQPNSAIAGAAQPAIGVDVEDQYGNIAADNSVVTITAGGQSFQSNAVNGIATLTGLPVTTAGTLTLSATDGALTAATSNQFNISPSSPAYLFIAQQPADGTAGSLLSPIAVQVFDQFGNLAASADSSISVSLNNAPSGANFTATSSDIANGQATFSNISLTTAGAYTLIATDGDLASATTATISVAPATAVKMLFVAQPTNTTAGSDMAPVTVELEDSYGNIASNDGSSVKLQATMGSAVFTAPVRNGLATFSTISFTQAGMQDFTASDGALPAINSDTITITPAAPASFKIISPSGANVAGQEISTVTAQVKDQFGNAISQSPVTVSIATGPTFANLTGTLTASTAANGMATFADLALDRAGIYTLGFGDAGVSATSAPFEIFYTAPQLVFFSEPSNIAAGGKLPALTINTDDADGNLLSSVANAKISLSISTGGKLIGTTTAVIKNGTARFNKLSVQKAGTYTLEVTAAGFEGAFSNSFTVSAGAISKLSFQSQPGSLGAGEPINLSVLGTDRYGNLVNNTTVGLALGVHPSGASFASSAELIDGVADFYGITIDTSGVYSFVITASGAKANSRKFVLA